MSAEKDVRDIISLFNAVASLCVSVDKTSRLNLDATIKYCASDQLDLVKLSSVNNILGLEYAELIPWRQGSLLYAFLNCKVTSDSKWLDSNQATFLNYLNEGIGYFQLMLSIRKPAVGTMDEEGDGHLSPAAPLSSISLDVTTEPFDEQKIEHMRKSLLQKQFKLGEQGQELEHLQEMLEHQQEINHEALLDIQQQLDQQPQLEEVLQEVQMEVQQQQQEVLDQQEEHVEQKEHLQDRQLQIQLQQQHLQAIMKELADRKKEYDLNRVVPEPKDPSTLRLIELGVYSDPHLLAMMYTAEMAYWYSLYSDQWSCFEEDGEVGGNLKRLELELLGSFSCNVYLDAVKNCGLAEVGWSCDRAVELQKYFEARAKGHKRKSWKWREIV